MPHAQTTPAGVNALQQQIHDEQTYIDPLADAVTETATGTRPSLKLALQKIFQGQDAYLTKKRAGHPITDRQMPDMDNLIGVAQRALNDIGERASVMQELIMEDVQTLKNMQADNGANQLLRDVLAEVLANENQIYFQETKGMASGAVLAGQKDRNAGINEKYRLDMQLNQSGGSAVRISSLVHEMTHIATQEKFGNTAIHLAFARGDPDNVVLDLSRDRTAQLTTLEQRLNATRGAWSDDQYSALQEKITYPVSGKNTLKSYADTFKNKGEMTQPDYDSIIGLVNTGANNTLIEFDTVINQMLYMMTAWNVPADNAFYVALGQIAQEAYDWRHR